MAYITAEQVKQMREQIKAKFPVKSGWKFSITREHYSGIRVSILMSPEDLRNDPTANNETVNDRYIEERKNKASVKPLKEILAIMNQNNFDKSDSMTDYFHVGHYCHLELGKWNEPYKIFQMS